MSEFNIVIKSLTNGYLVAFKNFETYCKSSEDVIANISEKLDDFDSLINYSYDIYPQEVSCRLRSILRYADLKRWDKVAEYTKKDFLALPNCGRAITREVEHELAERLLTFKKEI